MALTTHTHDVHPKNYVREFSTPFGTLSVEMARIAGDAGDSGEVAGARAAIVEAHYLLHDQPSEPHEGDGSDFFAELEQDIKSQLDEYFAGNRTHFDLPLEPGIEYSPFTHKVREIMCAIEPGEVKTYGEIAAEAGSPGAARAVGSVCRTNTIQLFVPCHRVVASDGSLAGYMGGAQGLVLKEQLLKLEGVPLKANGKVDFAS